MTKPEIIETTEPSIRELTPIKINDLVVAESKRVTHHLTLRPGQQLEDLLIADAWSTACPKLHVRDLVEVENEARTIWALFLVREVGAEHARLALLQQVDLAAFDPGGIDDLPLGHSVQFLGSRRLWAAMRGTQILRHGFSNKSSAVGWLLESTR